MYDLVIKNAQVFIGDQCQLVNADVGINNGIITCIEKSICGEHKRIIDAEGMYLSPGFIDIHGHSDLDILLNPNTTNKIRQGVTSEVTGNCGFSLFPVSRKYREEAFEFLSLIFDGLEKEHLFSSGEQYLQQVKDSAVNIIPFVGHNTLRIAVNGWKKRIEKKVLPQLLELLEKEFQSGITGLSTGLLYSPACFSTTDELLELGKLVKKYKGCFSWHIRDEGDCLETSLAEAVQVAKGTQVSTQISHLKVAGQDNWGKIPDVIKIIDKARMEGCNLTFDSYPYTFGCSTIITLLPEKILGIDINALINNLKKKNFRDKLKKEESMKDSLLRSTGAENIIIASGKSDFIGKSLYEIAEKTKKHIVDVLCDLIITEKGKTSIFLKQMKESDVEIALAHPEGFISTDGIPRIKGRYHPRLTDTYPRFLNHYVSYKHLCALPLAIRKMSCLPAKKLGLRKRGEIRIGNYADLCVFKPVANDGTASEEHNLKIVKYVIIIGQVTIDNGEFISKNKAGEILNNRE